MSSYLLRRVPRALPTTSSLANRAAFSTSNSRNSFAKMTIIGRLADTPELQATSTGQEILKYAVGTNSGPRDNQKTSWFRVTSFLPEGPQRDFISGLEKGTLVYIEGDASMSTFQDAEGKNRSSLNIVQQKLEVLSPKKQQQ